MSIPDGTIIPNAKELIKHAKHVSWMHDKAWAASSDSMSCGSDF